MKINYDFTTSTSCEKCVQHYWIKWFTLNPKGLVQFSKPHEILRIILASILGIILEEFLHVITWCLGWGTTHTSKIARCSRVCVIINVIGVNSTNNKYINYFLFMINDMLINKAQENTHNISPTHGNTWKPKKSQTWVVNGEQGMGWLLTYS